MYAYPLAAARGSNMHAHHSQGLVMMSCVKPYLSENERGELGLWAFLINLTLKAMSCRIDFAWVLVGCSSRDRSGIALERLLLYEESRK